MELEVRWNETDAGSYPVIVLTWEDGMRGAPGRYIAKCEDALFEYTEGEKPFRYFDPWDEEAEEGEIGGEDAL